MGGIWETAPLHRHMPQSPASSISQPPDAVTRVKSLRLFKAGNTLMDLKRGVRHARRALQRHARAAASAELSELRAVDESFNSAANGIPEKVFNAS